MGKPSGEFGAQARDLLRSRVAREFLWLYLSRANLIGSLKDYSTLLGRRADELFEVLPSLERLGIATVDHDPIPAKTAVSLHPLTSRRMVELRQLVLERPRGDEPRPAEDDPLEDLIGIDEKMLEVYHMVEAVSRTNATVLLLGEPGTGKKLVARVIHSRSLRAGSAFTALDCAAIPHERLAVELFGQETDRAAPALQATRGGLEEAQGSTIFLGEIAELPLDVQARLLHVIETGEFTPVGGRTPTRADVRLILATRRNLRELARLGQFREDLFYRINAVTIELPPLRERPGDLPLLVERCIKKISQRHGVAIRGIAPRALDRLLAYHWPGNVRELEHVIERALLRSRGPVIYPEDLALPGRLARALAAEPLKPLREMEVEYIRRVLRATRGNESRAARILGIHRDTLYRKIRRYRIDEGLSRNA